MFTEEILLTIRTKDLKRSSILEEINNVRTAAGLVCLRAAQLKKSLQVLRRAGYVKSDDSGRWTLLPLGKERLRNARKEQHKPSPDCRPGAPELKVVDPSGATILALLGEHKDGLLPHEVYDQINEQLFRIRCRVEVKAVYHMLTELLDAGKIEEVYFKGQGYGYRRTRLGFESEPKPEPKSEPISALKLINPTDWRTAVKLAQDTLRAVYPELIQSTQYDAVVRLVVLTMSRYFDTLHKDRADANDNE